TEIRQLSEYFVRFSWDVISWRYVKELPLRPSEPKGVDRLFIEHISNLGHLKSIQERLEELKETNIGAGKVTRDLALHWIEEAIQELNRLKEYEFMYNKLAK